MKWILLTVVFINGQTPATTQIPFPSKELCEKARSDLSSGLPKGGDWNSLRVGGSCLQVG